MILLYSSDLEQKEATLFNCSDYFAKAKIAIARDHLVDICTLMCVQFSKGASRSLRISLTTPVNSHLQYLSTWQGLQDSLEPIAGL